MGPPDKQPDFPVLDTYDLPGYRLVARAPTLWECNWLQVKDNSMDPAHLAFLHTLARQPGIYRGSRGTRRMGLDGDPGRHGLYRHAPARRPRLGAGRRFHPAQHSPVPAERRPDGLAHTDQPADGDDLGGAARRHPHDADRLSTVRPRARSRGAARVSGKMRAGLRRPAADTGRLRRASQHPWRHRAARARTPRLDRPGRDDDAQHDPAGYPGGAGRRRPGLPGAQNGEMFATFAHDRVVPGIPPAANPEEDSRRLREVARDVVAEMVRTGS